jgi:Tol biopolymer transport system component
LSPDGKRAVFAKRERGTGAVDLWVADLERGTESRLTFDSADERGIGSAVWSPDSSQILFRGRGNIYRKAASGAGDLETVLSAQELIPTDWSRDGRFVLLTSSFTNTLADLVILELGKGREPVPFLATPFVETGGRFSPDGRWIAYMSNESGSVQVYVQQFLPGRPASGARSQVSIHGGFLPVWRGDGKELFFRSLESKAMAVSVQVQGGEFKAGAPVALFETAAVGGAFEATRDGQRFLMIESVDQARSAPMTVIVNWQAGARK